MLCESEPACCCFAPNKPNLVFAGTANGSVLMWDIQELPSLHQKINLPFGEMVFRFPSYSTDGLFTQNGAHEEPIRSIIAFHQSDIDKREKMSATEEDQGQTHAQPFAVASIDEAGTMQLWVR